MRAEGHEACIMSEIARGNLEEVHLSGSSSLAEKSTNSQISYSGYCFSNCKYKNNSDIELSGARLCLSP